MLICILTKNVITSCSVTMMLFLHLEVKPLMTLTTVLYLSCALIRSEERFSRNAETDLVCRLLLEKKKQRKQYRWKESNYYKKRKSTSKAHSCVGELVQLFSQGII